MQHELSRNFGVGAECQYWDVGSVCRNHAWQTSLRRQNNNHGSISFFCRNHGRLCNGSIDALIRAVCLPLHKSIPRRKIRTGHGIFGEMFSAGNNLIHRLHDLNRVFALRGFSRQHHTISSVVDGVRNICHFGTRWSRILCHRLKHLRSNNDWLSGSIALRNHLLLRVRHLLNWNFHAQISSRHHDTIALFQYLIKVFQPGYALDFTNYQWERTPRFPLPLGRKLLCALFHVRLDFTHSLGVLNE
mmetsp:Transcript_12403/g.22444  ORF Transcript_12403/g.22444 Transcript_12403/m.22444 type:complete len:245 (-) Transcript_12403:936-1670(-)